MSVHVLYAALTNALAGGSYPAATVMLKAFHERDAVFVRLGVAFALFLPFLWRARGRYARMDGRDWLLAASAGLFGFALPLVLGTIGQKMSSATSASLLIGVEPMTIVLLSAVFLGEPFNRWKAAALALGLAGATLIAFQGPPRLGGAFSGRLVGDIILALHAVCWGLYSVFGKPLLRKIEAMDYAALANAFGFAGIAIWAGVEGLDTAAWAAAPLDSWLALLFLAFAVSFLGTWLWNAALAGLEASVQANFIFLQPAIGVLVGVGFLGDPFTSWTAIGGALVLASIWSANRA